MSDELEMSKRMEKEKFYKHFIRLYLLRKNSPGKCIEMCVNFHFIEITWGMNKEIMAEWLTNVNMFLFNMIFIIVK